MPARRAARLVRRALRDGRAERELLRGARARHRRGAGSRSRPTGFTFDVKLHRLLSRHARRLDSLPPDLREHARTTTAAGWSSTPELERRWSSELLERSSRCRGRQARRAAAPDHAGVRARRKHDSSELDAAARGSAPHPVAVELRNRAWVADERQAETLAWLSEHDAAFVCVDAPPGDHITIMPAIDAVTRDDLAYIRLHGRNTEGYLNGKTVAERFGWGYRDDELEEIAGRAHGLAEQADEVHVMFNNNRGATRPPRPALPRAAGPGPGTTRGRADAAGRGGLEVGAVELRPHPAALALVGDAPAVGQAVDEVEAPATFEVLALRTALELEPRAAVDDLEPDEVAGHVDAHVHCLGLGVTDAVGDQLGHQEADDVNRVGLKVALEPGDRLAGDARGIGAASQPQVDQVFGRAWSGGGRHERGSVDWSVNTQRRALLNIDRQDPVRARALRCHLRSGGQSVTAHPRRDQHVRGEGLGGRPGSQAGFTTSKRCGQRRGRSRAWFSPTTTAITRRRRTRSARRCIAPARASEAGPFTALATPGHSADSVCLLMGRVLFTGDTVLGEGSVFIAPGEGSLGAYLDSLRRLRELDLEVLCPGHGPYVWDPAAKIEEYLDHRLDRERRLLEALGRRGPQRGRAARRRLARRPRPPAPRGGADPAGPHGEAGRGGPAAARTCNARSPAVK